MGRRIDLKWDEWNPGLDTDDMTLAEVLATMPAADAADVPEIIRKYENPESPDALPGAISLERHDCIHVLLGRGLHVQDEAFVIGATMGAASDITGEIVDFFAEVSTTQYPEHWRFEEAHIASLRLGVGFAMDNLRGKDLHLIPLEGAEWQGQNRAASAQGFGDREGRATGLFPQGGTARARNARHAQARYLSAAQRC